MALLPLPALSSIREAYDVDEIYDFINSGAFATVYRAMKRQGASDHQSYITKQPVLPGSVVALKVIQKNGIKQPKDALDIVNEVAVLRCAHHPRIVKILDAFQTPREVVLVLEFVEGQELLQGLGGSRSVSEDRVKEILLQLVDALRYLHDEKHIVHRDLKPENILINKSGELTIVDFGLAKKFGTSRLVAGRNRRSTGTDFLRASSIGSDESAAQQQQQGSSLLLRSSSVESVDSITSHLDSPILATPCGTLKFAAPEAVRTMADHAAHWSTTRRVISKIDMYSIGIIAYVLLCGQLPYDTKNKSTLAAQMERGPQFVGSKWDAVSATAKDFVSRLLAADPATRMSAEEALHHLWLRPMEDEGSEVAQLRANHSPPNGEDESEPSAQVSALDERTTLNAAFQALIPPVSESEDMGASTLNKTNSQGPSSYFF